MAINQDTNAQNGAQGSSYMYSFGTSPETRAVMSQKVRILTPVYGGGKTSHQMGVLGSVNPTFNRGAEPVRGIGFGDIIAEIVPSVQDPVDISLQRTMLYLSNLWQATGYAGGVDGPVRSLAHHRWPFDIEQQLVVSTLADQDLGFENVGGEGPGHHRVVYSGGVAGNDHTKSPTGSGHSAIITMYECCWFTSTSFTFSKDSSLVEEDGTAQCTDIHDYRSTYGAYLASGNDPTIGEMGSIRYTRTAETSSGSRKAVNNNAAALVINR